MREQLTKQDEVMNQIDEMVKSVKGTLYIIAKQALRSGVLSEGMKSKGNYLLAKAVFDIWCQQRQYAPLDDETKKEFANLSFFI